MPEERPTNSSVMAWRQHLEKVWHDTHTNWATIDSYVWGRYPLWQKEDAAKRSIYYTHRARAILDRTNDNILPYKPQWHRDPTGEAEDAQRMADAVENWVDAVWLDASLSQTFLPAKEVGRNLLKYNYTCVEVGFDPVETEAGRNPMIMRVPHPWQVLMSPYERRPHRAIKRQRWYWTELQAYLKRKEETGADNLVEVVVPEFAPSQPYEMAEVTEEHSEDWHALVCPSSGGLLLLEKNLLGSVPFLHAFGGFGDMPSGEDGMNPKYRAQGFLWPALDLIKLLDQVLSAKAELEMKAAYAPMVGPEELMEQIAALMQQGANLIPGDVRQLGYLPIQQLPQYLTDFQDRIERAIIETTINTVAFGDRPVGVDTVGQHAMMLQVSFKRFVETMEQISFLTAQVADMWLRMLEQWGAPITVRGVTLSPQQVQGSYHIEARFPLSDEAVRQQRTQQGLILVQAGLKSRRRHLEEDQGVTDTTEEEDEILRDKVMGDPILHSALAEKKRQELGLQEMYEEQVERMKKERLEGFQGTQAAEGLPGLGGSVPQSEEKMTIRNAEKQSFIRPPAARPGTGQSVNGRGS